MLYMKEHDKKAKEIEPFSFDNKLSDEDKEELKESIKQRDSSNTTERKKTSVPKREDGHYEGYIGPPETKTFDPDI